MTCHARRRDFYLIFLCGDLKKKKHYISVLENSGVHVDVVQTFSFSLFMHSLFKLFNGLLSFSPPGLFALILCLSVFDQFLFLIKSLDFGL